MKGKPLQEYFVTYKDGTRFALWLPKMSAKKTRACIVQDATDAGQEVAMIRVVAADGSLSFLKR
jgi:hypothetical protein